jgi:superfamily II DNA or RNA helicase
LRFEIAALAHVRSLIAHTILGEPSAAQPIDNIDLKPHQIEAVDQAQRALAEFGGVLLADPVGTGKTFVALAIANRTDNLIAIGPAVLREMWQTAASRCGISLRFISFESLSRGPASASGGNIVIIDEAHHARNSATRRFANLARLVSGKQTIQISATPIHTRRDDLASLLSLFMGSRAESLSDAELARVVVRRSGLRQSIDGIPTVASPRWIDISTDERIPALLMGLPPPLPVSDGGDGGALVVHSLVRQWMSSDAALIGALRRRLVRAEAMIAALESDTWPSSADISSWISGEDTVQLGLPGMLASPTQLTRTLMPVVQCHRDALIDALASARAARSDVERAASILAIVQRHPERKIVVFSQYADSIDGLFVHLGPHGRVAALTGSGARVSGGQVSRSDVLQRFAPFASHASPARPAEEITLLLTTDLLSEGVNLQDAGIVIHLDFPWTPARMEQRLGRLTRIGSHHSEVLSFAFRPPVSGESIVRIEEILRRKMRDAGIVTETVPSLGMFETHDRLTSNPAHVTEEIRQVLQTWMSGSVGSTSNAPTVSAVIARQSGFLALVEQHRQCRLIAEVSGRISDNPFMVLGAVREVTDCECSPCNDEILAAIRKISAWLQSSHAIESVRVSRDRRPQRKLIERLDRIVQHSPRHERPLVARRAAVAHAVLASRLDAHAESELCALDTVDDDRVIDRIISIGSQNSGTAREAQQPSLKALIFFRK